MSKPRTREHDIGMSLKPLNWSYLAGYFDANGSLLGEKRRGKGLGLRLRVSSYDRNVLLDLRRMIGRGSIATEHKPKGEYYRLEIRGYWLLEDVLARMLPYLRVKRSMAERWLGLREAP